MAYRRKYAEGAQMCLTEVTSTRPLDGNDLLEVELRLITGRTHQIRGQFSEVGWQLLGDFMYDGSFVEPSKPRVTSHTGAGQATPLKIALQACGISFRRQSGEDINIEIGRERAWWSQSLPNFHNA